MVIATGSALSRGLIVVAVALLMLVPLAMLTGLVAERAQSRAQAIEAVARGWGGRQLVGAPVLAIPVSSRDGSGKPVVRDWYMLPERASMEAHLSVAARPRRIGIYEVPVYTAKVSARASFDLARQLAALPSGNPDLQIHLEKARLLVPVSDLRGVRSAELASGGAARFGPATGFALAALSAPFPASSPEAGELEVGVAIEFAGTESLAFLPFGRTVSVRAKGNWPHPGFANGFLPARHRISDTGFEADWQLLDLNRPYGAGWFQGEVDEATLRQSAFGVDIIQPVDLYQQVTRAVKYGGLFISVSLLTLFVFEHLARRSLHPVQYGLMGLALSVFYLLLLALAEHVGFTCAYIVAAVALCGLMSIYLAGALRSRRAGTVAGSMFAVVYSLLYVLVASEDYALLMGAVSLFALLATLMVLTRGVDWYRSDGQA